MTHVFDRRGRHYTHRELRDGMSGMRVIRVRDLSPPRHAIVTPIGTADVLRQCEVRHCTQEGGVASSDAVDESPPRCALMEGSWTFSC